MTATTHDETTRFQSNHSIRHIGDTAELLCDTDTDAAGTGSRPLRVLVLTLVALCSAYLALVRVVDPRGEFRTGLFPRVTADARRDKMELFLRLQHRMPIEGLVLGSSRSMKLRPSTLKKETGLSFFNYSVEGAKAEDYLAIFRWAVSTGATFKWL